MLSEHRLKSISKLLYGFKSIDPAVDSASGAKPPLDLTYAVAFWVIDAEGFPVWGEEEPFWCNVYLNIASVMAQEE